MANTIRMTREHGNPLTADVHPDEVENYRAAGFEVADNPLDHDGDGKAGGSVPGYYATAHQPAVKRAKAKRKAKGK